MTKQLLQLDSEQWIHFYWSMLYNGMKFRWVAKETLVINKCEVDMLDSSGRQL